MIQYVHNTHVYSYKIASIFPNNDKHQIISTFKTMCKARFKDMLTPRVADGRRTKQDVISLRDLHGRSRRPSCSAPSPPSALAYFRLVRLFVGLKMRVAVNITPPEPSPRGTLICCFPFPSVNSSAERRQALPIFFFFSLGRRQSL